jgi:RNA recognition motif-containing protein
METPSSPSNTLFIADIPSNVQESEFTSIFSIQPGFTGARLRKDRNNHIVGFVDFEDSENASAALESLQGFKLSHHAERGITIHFSHNATSSVKYRDGDKNFKPVSNRNDRSPLPQNSSLRSTNGQMDHGNRNGLPSVSFMPDLTTTPQTPPVQPQVSSMPNHTYPNIFPTLPADASSTLYVEGLPSDATEREVAHIFRPFPGYQSLRIITKESKQNPSRLYNLCFVEFDNKYQATFALNHLQGYRLDKDDIKGLTMSYAKTDRKSRQMTPPTVPNKFADSRINKMPSSNQRND